MRKKMKKESLPWNIAESQLYVQRAILRIEHSDCSMMQIADRLDQSIGVRIPAKTIEGDVIHAYFGIPKLLDKNDVENIFEKAEKTLVRVIVYLSPATMNPYTRFEIYYRDDPVTTLLSMPGTILKRYEVTADMEQMVVELIGSDPIGDIYRKTRDIADVSVISSDRISLEETDLNILTPREERLLSKLLERGFYSLPTRGATLKQIADELNISDSKLSLDVRGLSSKLFTEYLRRIARESTF